MTRNQISYWANQEAIRANLAREFETARSNKAQEKETWRHNLATERENLRSHQEQEKVAISEAGSHNISARAAETQANTAAEKQRMESEKWNVEHTMKGYDEMLNWIHSPQNQGKSFGELWEEDWAKTTVGTIKDVLKMMGSAVTDMTGISKILDHLGG